MDIGGEAGMRGEMLFIVTLLHLCKEFGVMPGISNKVYTALILYQASPVASD